MLVSFLKTLRAHMQGFLEFIRKQGVVSLAIGFILGGAVTKVVTALVTDIVNPLLGIILGFAEDFKTLKWHIMGADILLGDFISVLIDFMIIAGVIYFAVKLLGLEKIEKKPEKKA